MDANKPIYRLVDAVRAAIAEYNASGEHTPHGTGVEWCIACRLMACINGGGVLAWPYDCTQTKLTK